MNTDDKRESIACAVVAGVAPELLTLRQAAELCGVSERTLWTWAHDGTAPPAMKIGKGTIRYSRAAYVAWIGGGCQPLDGGANDEHKE